MKITIIIEDGKVSKIEQKETPQCNKWDNLPDDSYYDFENDEVRKKDLNKYGRCQNCGSIYSCWC
jgi:hypothetical protein